jgi:predicted NUDIX family phosphoesterase
VSEALTEQVLVVPTELFHRLGYFQGFSAEVDRYLDELFSPANTCYRPRHDVERDPGFKQLIPYVIFVHRQPGGAVRVFQYTRGTGHGEGRLHRKRSVGVGGHIASTDTETDRQAAVYEIGMQRELDEEVEVRTSYTSQLVGLINDDQTDVGRVHLGVVHVFEVSEPAGAPREPDIVDAGFVPVDELLADLEGFETWSSICLEALFGHK